MWASTREGTGTGYGQVGREGKWASVQGGGLTVQTWGVGARLEAAAKPGRNQVGSASWVRVTCLVDGAKQKKLELVCFFYPITFVNEYYCM